VPNVSASLAAVFVPTPFNCNSVSSPATLRQVNALLSIESLSSGAGTHLERLSHGEARIATGRLLSPKLSPA
jgi:hypothetical protein